MPKRSRLNACAIGLLRGALLAAPLSLTGCDGPASTLMPAGHEAERVATLFWIMLAVATVIWAAMVGIGIYAARVNPDRHGPGVGNRLILIGGAIFPTVTLAALLTYGLAMMPELRAGQPALQIHISGEQWWWRVTYLPPDGNPIESANEVRLPVDTPVEIILESPDVIHSFWLPAVAGKLDMIPGRTTRLVVRATRTGPYRGICAEFCGQSHARMNFMGVVMQQPAFERWLREQARPAQTEQGAEGAEAFLAAGCGACHTVRGTQAAGKVGPDLTHIGSRLTLAAGTLRNTPDMLARWIAHPEAIKPGVRMPPFAALGDDDIAAIATYLRELK